ncbi:MAG: GreA/GreB family elongation factor [Myxococcota bacterium]
MTELLRAVIGALSDELEAIERRALSAAEGATHDESRPEGPKDTRGLETSYLAHGLAERATELQAEIHTIRFLQIARFDSATPVSLGARIELEDDEGERRVVALLPCAGGLEIELDKARIRIVTPRSPLGSALLGKKVGDEIELRVRDRVRSFFVTGVT